MQRHQGDLKGVHAVSFHARTQDLLGEAFKLVLDVHDQVRAWIVEHPEHAVLHVYYDQWDSPEHPGQRGDTPSERLLNQLGFGPDPVWWHASATLYYDSVKEPLDPEYPLDPVKMWTDVPDDDDIGATT